MQEQFRSIINICFYNNFSTQFSIKALPLPLTFNKTLCLSKQTLLAWHFNYFCKYFPFFICNFCAFYFCIFGSKLDLFQETRFIIENIKTQQKLLLAVLRFINMSYFILALRFQSLLTRLGHWKHFGQRFRTPVRFQMPGQDFENTTEIEHVNAPLSSDGMSQRTLSEAEGSGPNVIKLL
jgi:hypothetical protein